MLVSDYLSTWPFLCISTEASAVLRCRRTPHRHRPWALRVTPECSAKRHPSCAGHGAPRHGSGARDPGPRGAGAGSPGAAGPGAPRPGQPLRPGPRAAPWPGAPGRKASFTLIGTECPDVGCSNPRMDAVTMCSSPGLEERHWGAFNDDLRNLISAWGFIQYVPWEDASSLLRLSLSAREKFLLLAKCHSSRPHSFA